MKDKRFGALIVASLLLAALACRPVFAIGWSEFLILVALIAVLLGPLLLRIYRTLETLRKAQDKTTDKKKTK
jgi:Flp pilus assembly protein TadB